MIKGPEIQRTYSNAEEVSAEARRQCVGALVTGGDHPSLAIARSLGRRGIPVYMLEDQHSIANYSRYGRMIRVGDIRDQQKTVRAVLEIGHRLGLHGWVLFPTRDENVAAFARHHDQLSRVFRLTTPCWATIRWAWDKKNTYALADQLGIPCPKTWTIEDVSNLADLDSKLPLAIKPAIKENFFYATGAKAWKAHTPQELRKFLNDAVRQVGTEEVMIQEIIPGDGRHQFSFCAFFKNGKAHSTLMARRMRQYPHEFGRAASYVESAYVPEIAELSERFLRAIDFYGLVEIEFKQDSRDGKYKLLDVNARAWGFHSLGQAAGVDFPLIAFADQIGIELEPCIGQTGVGWSRLLTDIPVSIAAILRGRLKPSSYLESLKRVRKESVFCRRDPLPWFAEAILLPFLVLNKHSARTSKYTQGQESADGVVPMSPFRVANEQDS